jgi:hypothetical protein
MVSAAEESSTVSPQQLQWQLTRFPASNSDPLTPSDTMPLPHAGWTTRVAKPRSGLVI